MAVTLIQLRSNNCSRKKQSQYQQNNTTRLATYKSVGLHFENKNYCYCSEWIYINYLWELNKHVKNQTEKCNICNIYSRFLFTMAVRQRKLISKSMQYNKPLDAYCVILEMWLPKNCTDNQTHNNQKGNTQITQKNKLRTTPLTALTLSLP